MKLCREVTFHTVRAGLSDIVFSFSDFIVQVQWLKYFVIKELNSAPDQDQQVQPAEKSEDFSLKKPEVV